MAERKNLELELDKPQVFELLFDCCVTGTSSQGKYYLYGLKAENGEEYSFFAPDDVNRKLKELKKGDRIELTKTNLRNGNRVKTVYEVNVVLTIKTEDNYFELMLKSYKDAIKIQSEINGMVDVNKIAISLFIARVKFDK